MSFKLLLNLDLSVNKGRSCLACTVYELLLFTQLSDKGGKVCKDRLGLLTLVEGLMISLGGFAGL